MSEETNVDCEQMAKARSLSLPEIPERAENEDDSAYKEKLIGYYKSLESQKYAYIVKNETMKVYNVFGKPGASDANVLMFKKPQALSVIPNIQDTAIVKAPVVNRVTGTGYYPESDNSCAITTSAVNEQICEKMGMAEEDRMLRGHGHITSALALNTENSKSYIEQKASVDGPDRKRFEKIKTINSRGRKNTASLNELVADGTIQPGDSFGIAMSQSGGNAVTGGSGCHAMTLVDVTRDESGKIIGYTLHANNKPHLAYHSVNNTNDWAGNKPVSNILPLSTYAHDYIDDKAKNLQNMSIEQIREQCSASIKETNNLISELKETELDNKYTKGKYVLTEAYQQEFQATRKKEIIPEAIGIKTDRTIEVTGIDVNTENISLKDSKPASDMGAENRVQFGSIHNIKQKMSDDKSRADEQIATLDRGENSNSALQVSQNTSSHDNSQTKQTNRSNPMLNKSYDRS